MDSLNIVSVYNFNLSDEVLAHKNKWHIRTT